MLTCSVRGQLYPPPLNEPSNRGSRPMSGVDVNYELHRGVAICCLWPYFQQLVHTLCADLRPVTCQRGGYSAKTTDKLNANSWPFTIREVKSKQWHISYVHLYRAASRMLHGILWNNPVIPKLFWRLNSSCYEKCRLNPIKTGPHTRVINSTCEEKYVFCTLFGPPWFYDRHTSLINTVLVCSE